MSKKKWKKPVVVTPAKSEPKKTFFQNAESWLGSKQRIILGLIITIAVLFRVIYFIQLNRGSCIWQHRSLQSDMNFYDESAKLIEHGDWLLNRSLHPFVNNSTWISDYYFKTHPEEVAQIQKQLGTDKSPEAMGKLLWHKWDGGKIYHQDPLYIYIVAVIYKIFGEDVRYVFVLQMITGIFTILLVYFITRKHFGNLSALISGLLAVCCGPLMFYELVLVRESFIVFAGLLLVFLMDKAFTKKTAPRIFILGAVTACCILLKSIFFLFMLLTLALLFFYFRKQPKILLIFTIFYLTGALLAYSPLIIRNAIVGVPLFSQNSLVALAVISANDSDYNPEQGYVINVPRTTEILSNTGGKAWPALISSVKTHAGIGSFLWLEFRKLKLVFHWYEFPNNKNFYYFRLHAPVLWFTFVNLLFIAPLGLAGIMMAVYQRKKLWSLYLLLFVHLIILVAFMVFSRYRIPFVAALIPFAGFAVAEVIKNIQVKKKVAWVMISGIIVMTFGVGRPLPDGMRLIRSMDYGQSFDIYYYEIIKRQMENRDYNGALKTMQQFLQFEPDEVKNVNSGTRLVNTYDPALFIIFGNIYSLYSTLYEKAGDRQSAEIQANRGKELKNVYAMIDQSGSLETLLNRANSAPDDQKPAMLKKVVEAASNEIKLNPNNVDNLLVMSNAYTDLREIDSAIVYLNKVLEIDSNNYAANFSLGSLYGSHKNDLVKAIFYLEKARILKPGNESIYANLGIAYGMSNNNDKALEMMRKAADLNPGNINNNNNLERLLRKLGRNGEADEVKRRNLIK